MHVMAAGLTALTAAFVALLPAAPSNPSIVLADHAFALDPPVDPGDGSLSGSGVLTPFDVQDPAVGRLDPAVLSAIQHAATAAAADGVTLTITSGWRSPEFQQRLLDDAVQTYGSFAAARQFVQTPQQSKHVLGEAVDVGGLGADQWLGANGSQFGLCRAYANEAWHFELTADAQGNCPPLLPTAAG